MFSDNRPMTLPCKRQRSCGPQKGPNAYSIREALNDGRSEKESRVVVSKRYDTGIGND
jgi:hypothetical protein